VDLSVTTAGTGVLVRVVDDGIGAGPVTHLAATGHFGLIEMRERAEIAGGWLAVHSPVTGGTTVEFWLPAVVS
jgi:signal transduction histidine kinase